MTESSPAPIHTLPIPDVYTRLGTSPGGLSGEQAQARLAQYGPNHIEARRRLPLRYPRAAPLALWVAALLAYGAGHGLTALALLLASLAVLAASILLASTPTPHPLPPLQAGASPHSPLPPLPSPGGVPSRGKGETSPARRGERGLGVRGEVPGDVIALYEGDVVPADARLVKASGLLVSAAALTGDPQPLVRVADPVTEPGVTAATAPNLVFAGMRVLAGSGRAVVFATGASSQFGRLAAAAAEEPPSLLGSELDWLSDRLTIIAAVLAGVTGLVGALAFGLPRAALTAAFILAAGVPVALAPVAAAGLGWVAARLRRQGMQIRSLSAIDALGAATVALVDIAGGPVPRLPGSLAVPVSRANPIAALAQAQRAGIAPCPEGEEAPRVVAAGELDALAGPELTARLAGAALVAETSGEHKASLVARLQAAGHAVAVRGDLLDDLPAMRQADVALATGTERSPVLREAAALVAPDSTAPARAATGGRRVYAGLGRAAALILAGIVPALAAALPAVLGAPPALTIAQLLAVRLCAEFPLALALALGPGDDDAPRGRQARLRAPIALRRSALFGALQAVLVLAVFLAMLSAAGWPPGSLGTLGAQWATPVPDSTPTVAPTPLAPGAPLPRPTRTPRPGEGAGASPATPAAAGGGGGGPAAEPDPAARDALRQAQAGAVTVVTLLEIGLAFALAMPGARATAQRWQAALFNLWPAAGVTLLSMAAIFGIEPLARGLGLAWPGLGPWALGLSAAMIIVLTAVAWRVAREKE